MKHEMQKVVPVPTYDLKNEKWEFESMILKSWHVQVYTWSIMQSDEDEREYASEAP